MKDPIDKILKDIEGVSEDEFPLGKKVYVREKVVEAMMEVVSRMADRMADGCQEEYAYYLSQVQLKLAESMARRFTSSLLAKDLNDARNQLHGS